MARTIVLQYFFKRRRARARIYEPVNIADLLSTDAVSEIQERARPRAHLKIDIYYKIYLLSTHVRFRTLAVTTRWLMHGVAHCVNILARVIV